MPVELWTLRKSSFMYKQSFIFRFFLEWIHSSQRMDFTVVI